MSDTGETAAGDAYAMRPGNALGTIQAGRGDMTDINPIERLAERVNGILKRSLPPDTGARANLDEVVAAILSLQDQMSEWETLLHLLHDLLAALAPFRAGLISPPAGCLSATERQALLQNWRPCQERMDLLADFAESIEHIGVPFQQTGSELHGEKWVVETVALRLLLEDTLKDDDLSPRSLHELAESLAAAGHRHLALVDRRLMGVTGRVQRLLVSLLGPGP